MPRLEAAIFDYLSSDPVIESFVGDKIFPVRGPDKVPLPYISWRRVSANRLYTYDRFADTDAWTTARIQFDCWATTANEAMEIGEAVLAALSGYEGDMSGQLIGSSFAVNEFDTFDTESKFHRRTLDFFVSYEDDVVGAS